MQGLVQEEAAESWAATIKKPLCLGPELLCQSGFLKMGLRN